MEQADLGSALQVGTADLALEDEPVAGTTVTFTASGVDPLGIVRLYWVNEGATGSAKCSRSGVCLDLTGKSRLAADTNADSAGNATMSVLLPAGAVGKTRLYQAFVQWDGGIGTTDVVTVDITDGTTTNEPPSPPTFSVTPDPARSNASLAAVITNPGIDPDGDTVTNVVTWKKGGATIHTGTTLDASLTTRDEVWTVEATATDGTFTSAPVIQTVTIENALPVASGVTIAPSAPMAGTLLTCSYTFSDADGDPNSSTVAWLANGSVVGAGSTHIYSGSGTVTCEVSPFDGREEGTAVSASTSGTTPPPSDGSGNILMVLLDDVGADQIGLYGIGSEIAPTPTIDELAATGVTFRHAYAGPLCSPTRAAVLTGRRGYRTGVTFGVRHTDDFVLSREEVLVPTMLGDGTGGLYDHSYIGKWHLNTVGDDFFGHPNVHGFNFYAGSMQGVGKAAHTSDGLEQTHTDWERVENGVPTRSTAYVDRDLTDTALERIAAMPEPWFLMYGTINAHQPFHTPPADLYQGPAVGGTLDDQRYHWMIEATDQELGRLLDSMDPGVLARTTVIVMGDNGTPEEVVAPEFDRTRQKRTLYEGGTHVPLIISSPLIVDGGREVDHLVEATDLFATFADIAGVDLDPAVEIDGVSLLPYLVDPAAPPQRDHVYLELTPLPGFGPMAYHDQMVRTDRYRLIRYNTRDELYDLLNSDVDGVNLLADGTSTAEQAILDELIAHLPF